MANTGVNIYLMHHQMIITNNQGFRFEFNIPTPGNIVVVHIGNETFQIGLYPPESPRSPNLSDLETDDSRPPSTPPNGGRNPGNPNQN